MVLLPFCGFPDGACGHRIMCPQCTDMQEKAKAKLCELAPAAKGSQEAGFTQPSLHLFLYVVGISNLYCIISQAGFLLIDEAPLIFPL